MNYPSKADIITSVKYPPFIKDTFLNGAMAQIGKNGNPILYTGGFSMVFPLIKNNEKWAFRVWHIEIKNVKERYKKISDYLNQKKLHYFSDFTFVEDGLLVNGNLLDTSRMKWVEGKLLKDFIESNLLNKNILEKLAGNFLLMSNDLHSNLISHGDLQHGNILISNLGEIKLVDYDSVCVPEIEGELDVVTGLKGYQHPSRFISGEASLKADYFSELIIYLSILAISENPTLWEKYQVKSTETLLFSSEDFDNWANAKIKADLNLLSTHIQSLLKILDSYIEEKSYLNLIPFSFYFNAPVIIKFKSNKDIVLEGVEALLSWEVENSKTIIISNGVGDVTGKNDILVKPANNLGYTLKAIGFFEETEQKVDIKVFPTPIIESIFVPVPEITQTIYLQIDTPKFPNIDISIKQFNNGINFKEGNLNLQMPNFKVETIMSSPPTNKFLFRLIKKLKKINYRIFKQKQKIL